MDGWMGGWLDGEDLIICVAIWTLYKRWGPLTSDDLLAGRRASRNRLRSTSLLEGIFMVFGAILGSLRRPKWTPNGVFRRFFSDAFFDRVLASILHGFLKARNLENHCFSRGKSMIFIKSTLSKKYRKIVNLGFVFGRQNVEKSIKQGVENHIFFWKSISMCFFGILPILARFGEVLGL